MKAEDVLALLAQKHSEDVFVPACKDGATNGYGQKLRILDAWTMRKSWAHWSTIGYEIKVSRSDFLGDAKWQTYLELCHEFSFVAPKGLIQLAELPADVGLIEVSAQGKRLLTRRKAVVRKIEPPLGVLLYVLMWRSRITREHVEDPLGYWRAWLAERGERRDIGHRVSVGVATFVQEMKARTWAAENAAERNEALEKALCELGFDPRTITEHTIRTQLADRAQLKRKLAYHLDCIQSIVGDES